VIEPIGDAEFLTAVREQVGEWRTYIYNQWRRKSQAYAILTMCRALHAYVNGEQVSKQQAARWAIGYLPQWETLIRNALAWREAPSDEGVDHAATFPETVRFVEYVGDVMGRSEPGG
jgi:hypothetical protein